MKVVGLITEYNPFHMGHKYHIEMAKKLTGADTAIVIMSGNYVQRGAPAFADKYLRAKLALKNGADLVIELPYCFAAASAQYFAYSAITILDRLGIVDYVCFGCEDDNLTSLMSIANLLSNEPPIFKSYIKDFLKQGYSYAVARKKAVALYDDSISASILDSPNNILAIEYLQALIKRNSQIKPVCLKRINASYHSSKPDSLYSATAIRNDIFSRDDISNLASVDYSYKDEYKLSFPITTDDFSLILGYELEKHVSNRTLTDIFGLGESLANRITSNIDSFTNYDDFISNLKTKELSYTSISRALLHCMLGTLTTDIDEYLTNDICDFVRILGVNDAKKELLGLISKRSNFTLLTGLSNYEKQLASLPMYNIRLLKNWINADRLYRMVSMNKFHSSLPNEYSRKLQKVALPDIC